MESFNDSNVCQTNSYGRFREDMKKGRDLLKKSPDNWRQAGSLIPLMRFSVGVACAWAIETVAKLQFKEKLRNEIDEFDALTKTAEALSNQIAILREAENEKLVWQARRHSAELHLEAMINHVDLDTNEHPDTFEFDHEEESVVLQLAEIFVKIRSVRNKIDETERLIVIHRTELTRL